MMNAADAFIMLILEGRRPKKKLQYSMYYLFSKVNLGSFFRVKKFIHMQVDLSGQSFQCRMNFFFKQIIQDIFRSRFFASCRKFKTKTYPYR